MAVLSSMSSHSRPTLGICTKWSITDSDENPASSAARAMVAEPRRRLRRAAGPREPADLQAEAHRHGSFLLAPGGGRCVVERSGHDLDGSVGDAVDGVEALVGRAASTVAASARSWLVTTADGTASGRARLRARVSPLRRVDHDGVARHAGGRGQRPVPGPDAWRRGRSSRRPSAARGRGAWPTISSRTSRASRVARRSWRCAADDGPQVVGRHHGGRVEPRWPPTSTCPIRPCRRARRGTDRAGGRPPGHTRAPLVHDRTMIFTTRCAGCDTPGATLCRTCRFALVSPRRPATPGRARRRAVHRPGPRRAARVQVPQPAGDRRPPRRAARQPAGPAPAQRGRRRHVGADQRPAPRASGGSTRPSSSPARSPGSSACRVAACSSAPAARRRRPGRPARRGSAGRRSGPTRGCRAARVLVVDDVVTTGATLHAAAAALRAAGATDVVRAAVAATPSAAPIRPAGSPERGDRSRRPSRWSSAGRDGVPCGDASRTDGGTDE